MSTTVSSRQQLHDSELLELCLGGEREAFGELVGRYQGLVCAQAYAICGDLGRSEDVAQEAFVAAWRKLGTLRDRSRFKAWLCGIARHLALGAVAARSREPAPARPAAEPAGEMTPHDALVSREEEAIVWHALSELPESYRAALVLYYREQHSVFEVAGLLGVSEDAVKQRLSRGRALLKQQVAAQVENALARSRPGVAFTASVLGATALLAPGTARAGVLAAGMAKGASPATLALLSWPVLGGLLGGAFGLFGGWLGVKASAENAQYERQRQAIFRAAWQIVGCAILFNALQFGAVWLEARRHSPPAQIVVTVVALTLAYAAWLIWQIRRLQAGSHRIAAEEQAAGTVPRTPSRRWNSLAIGGPAEYRSRATVLGWPLVHLLWRDPALPKTERGQARGWIAVGDAPVGFLAIGGMARGVIAFGGLSLGVVSIGGVGLGLFSLGGCALGAWCYGGVGAGWEVNAGLALGWHFALGAIAAAHEAALGNIATALHVNDATAAAALAGSTWMHLTMRSWFSLVVPLLVVVVFAPVLGFWRRAREATASRRPATPGPRG